MRILALTNMYPTPQNPSAAPFVEQQIKGLRQIGVDVEVIFVDRAQHGMSAYWRLGSKLLSKIKELQVDLMHVMYGGIISFQATRIAANTPTVVTFHGSDLFGERLSGMTRRMIAGCGVRASWAAARRASGIVTVSDALKRSLPEDVDRGKVRVIPCGIDIGLFKPLDRDVCRNKLGWKPDGFHILFAANTNNPIKRPELARAAVNALFAVGISAELHSLCRIPYDEVPVWINASDCLVLTSLNEGSPTIIKEALACNLPVVSVDVGDVRERIRGIEGCHLAPPDPTELASKLWMVYSGRRSVSGRERMQEFSLDSIARRLVMFYCDTLASHMNSPLGA